MLPVFESPSIRELYTTTTAAAAATTGIRG